MTASAPPCAASPRRGNARGRYLYLWMTTKAQMHAALPVALRTSARQTSLPLRERTFSSGARPHRALRIPAACAFGASLLALLPTLGASRRPGPRPRGTCVLCTAHASPLPVPRCCCCLHTNLLPSSYIAAAAAPEVGKSRFGNTAAGCTKPSSSTSPVDTQRKRPGREPSKLRQRHAHRRETTFAIYVDDPFPPDDAVISPNALVQALRARAIRAWRQRAASSLPSPRAHHVLLQRPDCLAASRIAPYSQQSLSEPSRRWPGAHPNPGRQPHGVDA